MMELAAKVVTNKRLLVHSSHTDNVCDTRRLQGSKLEPDEKNSTHVDKLAHLAWPCGRVRP